MLAVAVALIAVGCALIGYQLWPRDAEVSAETPAASPAGQVAEPDVESSAPAPPAVETEKNVTIDGDTVVVVETSTVVDGGQARAVPAEQSPTGLDWLSSKVVGEDGRSTPFTSPVTVVAGGTLTVESRYRLTDCPDVLPALWPSPTAFAGAVQTYVRLDQPLHTGYAVCPDRTGQSASTAGLTATVAKGPAVRIQIRWDGAEPLSISGIGSASGVAAVPVSPSASCGSDTGCLAVLDAVTTYGVASSAAITVTPADPCPPATTSDRLVLLVARGDLPPRPTALVVDGLHRAVCSAD